MIAISNCGNFFRPVYENNIKDSAEKLSFLRPCTYFFDLGSNAYEIKQENKIQYLVKSNPTDLSLICTIVRVMLSITLVFPIVMGIGSVIYHLANQFKENQNSDAPSTQKLTLPLPVEQTPVNVSKTVPLEVPKEPQDPKIGFLIKLYKSINFEITDRFTSKIALQFTTKMQFAKIIKDHDPELSVRLCNEMEELIKKSGSVNTSEAVQIAENVVWIAQSLVATDRARAESLLAHVEEIIEEISVDKHLVQTSDKAGSLCNSLIATWSLLNLDKAEEMLNLVKSYGFKCKIQYYEKDIRNKRILSDDRNILDLSKLQDKELEDLVNKYISLDTEYAVKIANNIKHLYSRAPYLSLIVDEIVKTDINEAIRIAESIVPADEIISLQNKLKTTSEVVSDDDDNIDSLFTNDRVLVQLEAYVSILKFKNNDDEVSTKLRRNIEISLSLLEGDDYNKCRAYCALAESISDEAKAKNYIDKAFALVEKMISDKFSYEHVCGEIILSVQKWNPLFAGEVTMRLLQAIKKSSTEDELEALENIGKTLLGKSPEILLIRIDELVQIARNNRADVPIRLALTIAESLIESDPEKAKELLYDLINRIRCTPDDDKKSWVISLTVRLANLLALVDQASARDLYNDILLDLKPSASRSIEDVNDIKREILRSYANPK